MVEGGVMKRILYLIICSSWLFGNTLVVDNTVSWGRSCEGFGAAYTTIQEAVNDAEDGDVIKICKGTYDEEIRFQKNFSSIKFVGGADVDVPTDVIWKSDRSPLTVDSSNLNIKIEKLSFKSKEKYGIYFKRAKDIAMKDVTLESQNHAIYIGKNTDGNYHFINIKAKSYDKKGISVAKGAEITCQGITVESEGASIYFGKDVDGDYSFTDLNLTSHTNNGIYIKQGRNISLEDVNISAEKNAISFSQDVVGDYTFKNMRLSSNSDSGIHIRNGGDVNVSDSYITSEDSAIYLSNDIDGNYIFKNLEINSSKKSGIKIVQGKNVTVNDTNITSEEETIFIKNKVYGDVVFKNLRLVGYAKDGVQIDKARNIDIEDSCIFKEAGTGKYGILIRSDNSDAGRPIVLKNNCLYGTPVDTLAKAKYQNTVDPNYWEGLTEDTYDYNRILDNAPLSSCPNHCEQNDLVPPPILDYRMDECSWNGSSGEVKDSSGNGHTATAKNGADTESNTSIDGMICHVADFDGKYIELDATLSLNYPYSMTFWLKFPLQGTKDQVQINLGGWFHYYKVYVVASVEDRGDVALFLKDDSGDYRFGVYDNDGNIESIDIPDPSDGWHFFALISKSGETTLYMDKDTDDAYRVDTATKGDLTLVATSTDSSDKETIGTYMDEVKFFDVELSKNEMTTIYQNENDRKNYDGTSRICPVCSGNGAQSGRFNAVSSKGDDDICSASDDWENNLSTQIAKGDYTLYILAKEDDASALPLEANITKIALYYFSDGNQTQCSGTPYKKITICENGCGLTDSAGCLEKNISKSLNDRSAPCVQVHIEGRDVNATAAKTQESNSTDDYAIRPERFGYLFSSLPLYAGSRFEFDFNATDAQDGEAVDYNESNGTSFEVIYHEVKVGCKTGKLSLDGFTFSDGEADHVGAVYEEVGQVNIRLQEINGSEFAKVDRDDTLSDSVRLIEPYEANLTFFPHHFTINAVLKDFDTDTNFTYLSQDLNLSAKMDLTIEAENEQNETTRNYVYDCYAKDLDINITHSPVKSTNLSTLLYILNDANDTNLSENKIAKDEAVSFVYDSINFSTVNSRVDENGTTVLTLFFNFDRNASKPVNPYELNMTDINVTDGHVGSDEYEKMEGNVTFYYGRLRVDDVETTKRNITHRYILEVYDSNESDPSVDGMRREGLFWWFNDKDQKSVEGNITSYDVKKGFTLSAADDAHLSLKNFSDPVDGVVTFDLEYDTDVSQTVRDVVHLNISPWLWYVPEGLGGDYDYGGESDCTRHPCFEYVLYAQGGAGVRSGEMNGSDFAVPAGEKRRSGIKLFR